MCSVLECNSKLSFSNKNQKPLIKRALLRDASELNLADPNLCPCFPSHSDLLAGLALRRIGRLGRARRGGASRPPESRGRGDDNSVEARGAAKGLPNPISTQEGHYWSCVMGLTMLFSHCIFLCDTILQIFQALGHYYMSGDSFSYVSAYFQAENVG
uniref:Uncharacterized protein n=1 Tax=Ananas comosus var. bracteatus TaxID=296719 RepID=A0A6V7QEP6_ANACO|nr:unnamed protein product [Ananas comosus var. bracteatus]